MHKRCIMVEGAPAAGPYSHAVEAGGLLFVSGQGPLAADGSVAHGPIEEETRLALDNLRAVLEASGASLRDVVKVSVFLADMDEFAAFNEVYAEYFPEDRPARTCVEAARLPAGFRVEVDAIAALPAGRE